MSAGSGRFIVFEGCEGSGKSTAASAVAARLAAEARPVLLTREPGGTPVGEQIRALLHERLSPWAELFAFLAARAELVERIVRPALGRGEIVLCDRFAPSTFAYQVHARGLDAVIVRTANRAATGGLEPDLIVYLDLDPAAGLARKEGEGAAIATAHEGLAFHRKVREGYLLQARDDPARWAVIDASLPAERVATLAYERVLRALG